MPVHTFAGSHTPLSLSPSSLSPCQGSQPLTPPPWHLACAKVCCTVVIHSIMLELASGTPLIPPQIPEDPYVPQPTTSPHVPRLRGPTKSIANISRRRQRHSGGRDGTVLSQHGSLRCLGPPIALCPRAAGPARRPSRGPQDTAEGHADSPHLPLRSLTETLRLKVPGIHRLTHCCGHRHPPASASALCPPSHPPDKPGIPRVGPSGQRLPGTARAPDPGTATAAGPSHAPRTVIASWLSCPIALPHGQLIAVLI